MSKEVDQAGEVTVSRRRMTIALAGAAGLGLTGAALGAQTAPVPAGKPARIGAGDKLAIIELIGLYAWYYDCGDAAAFAGTFTEDGVLEIFGTPRGQGRAAIEAFIRTGFEMRGDAGWQHLTDHHHFRDYTGNSVKVYSYYLMPVSDANGGNVTLRAMGYYVSDCVKVDGEWLFARREVFRWTGALPWQA